ncbi:MAG: hypothetical protein PHU76_01750 [Synergistaceae bacterium]|nr:hypothetical protein [Proteiniphilum sp.]MDD3963164.1 hypothetical protein [Synergistaceae bacterium]
MQSKKEIVDDALEELIYKIQEDAGEENPALKHADAELMRLGEVISKDPEVDEKTRDILTKYVNKTISVTGKQFQYLYVQGMKDCVTLLRELGVIQ